MNDVDGYYRFAGKDCGGYDILPIYLAGEATCKEKCDKTPECVAFVLLEWREGLRLRTKCHLKSKCDELVALKSVYTYKNSKSNLFCMSVWQFVFSFFVFGGRWRGGGFEG